MRSDAKTERNEEIVKRRKSGETLKQISLFYGISRGRVVQIVRKAEAREDWNNRKDQRADREKQEKETDDSVSQEPSFFKKFIRTLSSFRQAT